MPCSLSARVFNIHTPKALDVSIHVLHFFPPSTLFIWRIKLHVRGKCLMPLLDSESCQLKWDSGIGLSTTGVLTLISYLLPLLPFYMAASRDDISASTAALAEGFLSPAVGGTCVHWCLSPDWRRTRSSHPFHTVTPTVTPTKWKAGQGEATSRCTLMVIAKQKGVKTGQEMGKKKKKHVVVVSVVTVRARSTCLSDAPALPYLLLLSSLLANCDICSWERLANLNVNILALNRNREVFVTQRQSSLKWKVSKTTQAFNQPVGARLSAAPFKHAGAETSHQWVKWLICPNHFPLPLSVESWWQVCRQGGLNMTPLWLLMNPLLGTLLLCHPEEQGLSLVEAEVIKKAVCSSCH